MFELPEAAVLARQLAAEISGQEVVSCVCGHTPHKFAMFEPEADEFARLAVGRMVGQPFARAKWIFVPMEPGLTLALGELGGKLLLNPRGARLSAKHHFLLELADGRTLTATIQMWAMFGLWTAGELAAHRYAGNQRPAPTDAEFTREYWRDLVRRHIDVGRGGSVKSLLTQDGTVPGVGNSYLQDILFEARLHPRRPVASLSGDELSALHRSMREVLTHAIELGGRNDEVDLYGRPGGYARVMHSGAVGQPCPLCGTDVVKIQYLGGACYYCPSCQV